MKWRLDPGQIEVVDITVTLGTEAPVWPGDTAYRREMRDTMAGGGVSDVSELTLSAHAGTHVDSPAHFIAGAKTLDAYGIERFVLPATVVDAGDAGAVRAEHLAGADVRPGEALLVRTRNSARGLPTRATFNAEFVALTADAAEWCVAKRLGMVGIDYLSIDPFGDCYDVHYALLGHDVLVLECVNLAGVAPGRYTLACLPLKLPDCEAAPVRAVLLTGR